VRDRSDLPASVKKIDLVPKLEIQAALLAAIEAAFSLSKEDAISEALSLMGFQRTTAKSKQIVAFILQGLVEGSRIKEENTKMAIA